MRGHILKKVFSYPTINLKQTYERLSFFFTFLCVLCGVFYDFFHGCCGLFLTKYVFMTSFFSIFMDVLKCFRFFLRLDLKLKS